MSRQLKHLSQLPSALDSTTHDAIQERHSSVQQKAIVFNLFGKSRTLHVVFSYERRNWLHWTWRNRRQSRMWQLIRVMSCASQSQKACSGEWANMQIRLFSSWVHNPRGLSVTVYRFSVRNELNEENNPRQTMQQTKLHERMKSSSHLPSKSRPCKERPVAAGWGLGLGRNRKYIFRSRAQDHIIAGFCATPLRKLTVANIQKQYEIRKK